MYITREIESTIDAYLKQGKVILVTGARQVGKTTALKKHLGNSFHYVSLENPSEFALAKQDSVLFFEQHTLPLIIDEVQRVPELFSPIKWQIDQSDAKGQMVLTGSQTYHLMKGVSESLAGRIRILEMPPLCLREIVRNRTQAKSKAQNQPQSKTQNQAKNQPHNNSQNKTQTHPQKYVPHMIKPDQPLQVPEGFDLWEIIHRGSMPELQNTDIDWDGFYTDYEAAYLERDVRDLINVKDEVTFYNFMIACAARTGQLLNASDIANSINVSHKTVTAWLSILQASNIIRILYPFWPNVGKRLSKTPKIYFMDTGLVCHLTRWNSPDQLRNGAAAGHIFETFVVSEVLKSYMNTGANLRDVWFYRDTKKREIDLVIQDGHVLHPVEIKTGALIKNDAVKNFSCLESLTDYKVGFGHVICQTPEPYLIQKDVQAIPVWEL